MSFKDFFKIIYPKNVIPITSSEDSDKEVLRRIHRHKVTAPFTGIINKYTTDVSANIQNLIKHDLIRISTLEETINQIRVVELKDILNAYNLCAKGKKQELINTLLNNLTKAKQLDLCKNNFFYIRTELGTQVNLAYLEQLKKDEFDIQQRCYTFIKKNKIKHAIKALDTYNTSKICVWENNFSANNKTISFEFQRDYYVDEITKYVKHLERGTIPKDLQIYMVMQKFFPGFQSLKHNFDNFK